MRGLRRTSSAGGCAGCRDGRYGCGECICVSGMRARCVCDVCCVGGCEDVFGMRDQFEEVTWGDWVNEVIGRGLVGR